jgi:uncharacterized protein YegL
MSLRRLPVYILADCSGSMAGDPIESVKQGIRELCSNLMGDPSAIESAYLSVITFSDEATQVVPLTEIAQFVPPDLQAGGTTHLGAAIKLLMDCIEREVNKSTAQVKGDWKPLIFIMSDGDPSDDHRAFANELKTRRYANVIALACGDAAPANALKDITESVLQMRDMSPGAFKQFFKWVSQSIKQTSQKCSASPNDVAQGISLPPPPQGITIVP